MMRKYLPLFAFVLCVCASHAQGIPTVQFCDLVRNPAKYNGMKVRSGPHTEWVLKPAICIVSAAWTKEPYG
jgi:hypothetical protein